MKAIYVKGKHIFRGIPVAEIWFKENIIRPYSRYYLIIGDNPEDQREKSQISVEAPVKKGRVYRAEVFRALTLRLVKEGEKDIVSHSDKALLVYWILEAWQIGAYDDSCIPLEGFSPFHHGIREGAPAEMLVILEPGDGLISYPYPGKRGEQKILENVDGEIKMS